MSFPCVGYPSGSRCCDHSGKGVQSWFESLSKAELCPGSPAWSWWDLGLGCQQNDWNLGAAGYSGCLLPWKHPVAPCLFGTRWHWRVGRTRCTFPTWSERLWSVAVVCVWERRVGLGDCAGRAPAASAEDAEGDGRRSPWSCSVVLLGAGSTHLLCSKGCSTPVEWFVQPRMSLRRSRCIPQAAAASATHPSYNGPIPPSQ